MPVTSAIISTPSLAATRGSRSCPGCWPPSGSAGSPWPPRRAVCRPVVEPLRQHGMFCQQHPVYPVRAAACSPPPSAPAPAARDAPRPQAPRRRDQLGQVVGDPPLMMFRNHKYAHGSTFMSSIDPLLPGAAAPCMALTPAGGILSCPCPSEHPGFVLELVQQLVHRAHPDAGAAHRRRHHPSCRVWPAGTTRGRRTAGSPAACAWPS